MKRFALLPLISLLILCESPVHAGVDSLKTQPNTKSYFKAYALDAKDIVLSPISWKKSDWLIFGAGAGLTAVLYNNDRSIQTAFQNAKTPALSKAVKYGLEPWGSGLYSLSTLGIYYVYGSFAHDPRDREIAMNGLKTFVVTGLVANVAKQIFHRHRPFQADLQDGGSPYVWEGPFVNPVDKLKYSSFPSGHTTSAFAMATYFAMEYKDKVWVGCFAYGLATLTGVSRIYDNKHWASDVCMGALFGYAMSKLIHKKNNWGIEVKPGIILQ